MAMADRATITVRDAKKILNYSVKNNLKRSLMFLGASGIGKSEFIKQVADENGIGFKDVRLLTYTESDLKGIPAPDLENNTTKWLPNNSLPYVERDGEKGILLLDEITSASKRIQAAAYQLTLDRKIGEYELPEGWTIVAAGNREDDDGLYIPLLGPLANRFEIHELHTRVDYWREDYAYKAGVNPFVIAYLGFNRKHFHTRESFGEEGQDYSAHNSPVFASPRAWVAVSDILNAGIDYKSPMARMMITGNVGEMVANQFIQYCHSKDSMVKVDDILAGKDVEPPKEKDVLFMLFSSLITAVRDDVVNKKDSKAVSNVIKFFFKKRENPEFVALGIRDLFALNKEFIKKVFLKIDTPEVDEFLAANTYLWEEVA